MTTNSPPDDIDAQLDAARGRLHTASLARLAAEAEYNAAETALYDLWMSTIGSDRYKRGRYAEDQREIKREIGATW